MDQLKNQQTSGILNGLFAYLIWGVLPLYWVMLKEVNATQILAQRIVWSFIFMLVILLVLKKWDTFFQDAKKIVSSPIAFGSLVLSSVLISGNWLIYIWAVNAGHVLETSLGYYINPLISVLMGVAILKEKLDFWQKISFSLAAIGVLVLTIHFGTIPWIALSLAFSFAFYGLAKKKTNISSISGLTFETMAVTPIAIFYLIYVFVRGEANFGVNVSWWTNILLIGTGVVTAVPLLLFAESTKKITLTLIGFLQYVAPTIALLIGVFILNESFTIAHFIAFGFIWAALVVYSVSRTRGVLKSRHEQRLKIKSS